MTPRVILERELPHLSITRKNCAICVNSELQSIFRINRDVAGDYHGSKAFRAIRILAGGNTYYPKIPYPKDFQIGFSLETIQTLLHPH